LAIFAAIRRASSFVSSLAAERRPGFVLHNKARTVIVDLTRGSLVGTFDIMIYYISKVFWLIAAPTSALILVNMFATFWALLGGSTFAAWLAAAAACGLVIAAFTPIGFALMILENRFALSSLSESQAAPDGIIFLTAPWPKLAALNQRFPKSRIIFSGYTVSETDSENLLVRLWYRTRTCGSTTNDF
jgi:hypothetical protein